MLGFIGFCWGLTVAVFLGIVNQPFCAGLDENMFGGLLPDGISRALFLSLMVFFAFLPVLATIDVATTSSCCDLLMDEINQARQRHGPEANDVITWLESSLEKLVRSSHDPSCGQLTQ